jgi:membrane protein CcdC involved in cytochrome C biogenesis
MGLKRIGYSLATGFMVFAMLPFIWVTVESILVPVVIGLVIGLVVGKLYRSILRG